MTGMGGQYHRNIHLTGGPRLSKTSMVCSVPVLQQLHFLTFTLLVGFSKIFTFNFDCNFFNFIRFQVLLKNP